MADIILVAEEEAFQEEVNIAHIIFAVIVCCHRPSPRPRMSQWIFIVS